MFDDVWRFMSSRGRSPGRWSRGLETCLRFDAPGANAWNTFKSQEQARHVPRVATCCHVPWRVLSRCQCSNVPMSNACPNVCSLKLLPTLAAKLREANTAWGLARQPAVSYWWLSTACVGLWTGWTCVMIPFWPLLVLLLLQDPVTSNYIMLYVGLSWIIYVL